MKDDIRQIYDRIFKRIFSLSNKPIINMINGLFGTNYPLDSSVSFPNRESTNRTLKSHIADVFLVINKINCYHLEAQMQKDKHIILRVFEYGFHYALENGTDDTLPFPNAMVIYLSKEVNIPEESALKLNFGEQGIFEYKVKNYVYLDHDVEELNQKKMVILIPFQLLKLKEIVHKIPTKENYIRLQELLQNDIISSINENRRLGNITQDDAEQLMELTKQLYIHLYKHYYEIGGYEDMKALLPGALELPGDKYRLRIGELEEMIESVVAERKAEEARREKAEAEIQRLKELLEKQQR